MMAKTPVLDRLRHMTESIHAIERLCADAVVRASIMACWLLRRSTRVGQSGLTLARALGSDLVENRMTLIP